MKARIATIAATGFTLLACVSAPPPPRVARATPAVSKPTPAPPLPAAPPPILYDEAGVAEIFTDPDRLTKLRRAFPAIDASVAKTQRDLKLPGLAVGIVIDGELAHVAAAGHQNLEKQSPVTADSVFRIGSVTKTLTAAAILKLRDDGKLSLDDAAVKYLPELARVRYPTRDSPLVSVHHLLTHTSGLPRSPRRQDERIANNQPLTREELRSALVDAPVAFAPGSASLYSNLGYTLLGLIVESAAKIPFRAYVAKHFFEPLGMTSPGWERARLPAAHVALPYESKKDSGLTLVEEEEQLGLADASGGLYLSVRDLARWVGFNLAAYPARSGGAVTPLRRATLREMHRPSAPVFLGTGRPFTVPTTWIAEPWAGSTGFAWDATALCEVERLIEKGGFVERYQTITGFFPNEGIGIVVVTNTGHVDALKRRAFFDVLALLRQTGGVSRRTRVAQRTPELDAALARLLDVMHAWNEDKYLAMLTAQHKKNVPTAVEKAELAGYQRFHGHCKNPKLVRYDSRDRGRYRLDCERGRFEMDLTLDSGLIDGFVGTSTDVAPEPETLAVAVTELAKRSRDPAHKQRHGRCKLGKLRDRDGNRWYRFELACDRGPTSILAIRISADDASKLETAEIEPTSGGACGVIAQAAEGSSSK